MKKKSIIILAVTLAILLILAIVLPLVLLLPKKKSPSSEMISMAKAKEYMVNGLKTTDDPENRNVFKVLGNNVKTDLACKSDGPYENGGKSIVTMNSQLNFQTDKNEFVNGCSELIQELDSEEGKFTHHLFFDDDYAYIIYDDKLNDNEDYVEKATSEETDNFLTYIEEGALLNPITQFSQGAFSDEGFEKFYQDKIKKTYQKDGFYLTFDIYYDNVKDLYPSEYVTTEENFLFLTLNVYFNNDEQIFKLETSAQSGWTHIAMFKIGSDGLLVDLENSIYSNTIIYSKFENVDPTSNEWYVHPDWFNTVDWDKVDLT